MPYRRHEQIWVPYNGKIADITHADTNKHTLDLGTALNEKRKIIGLNSHNIRIAGSGSLYLYPNEGTMEIISVGAYGPATVIIADGTQRLQYSLSVANDDYDLYCNGYVVEA